MKEVYFIRILDHPSASICPKGVRRFEGYDHPFFQNNPSPVWNSFLNGFLISDAELSETIRERFRSSYQSLLRETGKGFYDLKTNWPLLKLFATCKKNHEYK